MANGISQFSTRAFHGPNVGFMGCEFEVAGGNKTLMTAQGQSCNDEVVTGGNTYHTAASSFTAEEILAAHAAFVAAHGGALVCKTTRAQYLEFTAPALHEALVAEQMRAEQATAGSDSSLDEVLTPMPVPALVGKE